MVEIGKQLSRTIEVDETRAISFMGPELRVYATPSILSDIEFACRDLLLTMIDEGMDSVGSQVTLEHVGAAKLGRSADVVVTVAEANKRSITFSASVTCDGRAIANASHVRTIVSVVDLKARIGQL
ncbi:fluoroacetyl-CoA thioesterase [Bradyrhizobium sp. AZCC 1577]|uniref:thioesterase family protein n=1 Tax=Bradyrhizobium sp. AZCC 1577 TaxID=3117019 RepID=UPI002FF05854